MHLAMAMIEVIFAIVIIAISVMTIPSMMNIADNTSKAMMIDEDVLKRMKDEITKVYSARWDQNSVDPFGPLQSAAAGLNCAREGGLYRNNPNTVRQCLPNLPSMSATPATGNLNLSQGLEQLHNKDYNLTIDTNTNYKIPIAYNVSYVTSTISALDANGVATATWRLGTGGALGAKSDLKRVVVSSQSTDSDTHIVLTYFKSNTGMLP